MQKKIEKYSINIEKVISDDHYVECVQKRFIGVRLRLDTIRSLKNLVMEHETTLQEIASEAFSDLIDKYKNNPYSELLKREKLNIRIIDESYPTKILGVFVELSLARNIKRLAAKYNTTMNRKMGEAICDLLDKYKKIGESND